MKQYINKADIIEKIKKRIKETESMQSMVDPFWEGQISAFDSVLKILDTIETKEVDLEKEMDFAKDAYYYFTSDEKDSMMKVARHFFELGFKPQKGT